MNDIVLEDHQYDEDDKENKDSIKFVSDIIQALSKAGKTIRIYPETSPVRQKIIDKLMEQITTFLNQYGELSLRIRQFELTYNNEIVYSNTSKKDSLAFKFFGDGIRELKFTDGIETKEILDFIKIITKTYTGKGQNDDIVTMLWENDFKNIHHTVAEYMEEGDVEARSPEENASTGSGTGNFYAIYNTEVTKDTGGKTLNAVPGHELEIEAIYKKPISEIFILTQEEIDKIRHEMEMDEGMDLITGLLDILFHILQIEKGLDIYSEILKSITDTLKTCILSGEYQQSVPILTTLKTLSIDENNFSPAHAKEVQCAIDSMGEEPFLNQLTSSIKINKLNDITPLFSILTMLNKNAIEPLSSLSGTVGPMKTRRLICDVLAQLSRDDIKPLINKLEDDNWHIVRNMVYVLGKTGSTEAIKSLSKIKDHPEPKVRKEIVHAVSEINSEEAREFLVYYLEDKDSSVSQNALRNIAGKGYLKAVPAILKIITSESFNIKEASGKREFFNTLAILKARDSLPFLRNLLMKRTRIFGKARIVEKRTYAVYTLKKMATTEAKDILREGLLHPDKGIRNICEETLREMEHLI